MNLYQINIFIIHDIKRQFNVLISGPVQMDGLFKLMKLMLILSCVSCLFWGKWFSQIISSNMYFLSRKEHVHIRCYIFSVYLVFCVELCMQRRGKKAREERVSTIEREWEREREREIVAGKWKREDNNANWHFRNEMLVALATGPWLEATMTRWGRVSKCSEEGWGRTRAGEKGYKEGCDSE